MEQPFDLRRCDDELKEKFRNDHGAVLPVELPSEYFWHFWSGSRFMYNDHLRLDVRGGRGVASVLVGKFSLVSLRQPVTCGVLLERPIVSLYYFMLGFGHLY